MDQSVSLQSPPAYDLLGGISTVSVIIAAEGNPETVNVTSTVYLQVIQTGFDIEFENEIEWIEGTIVHRVRQSTEVPVSEEESDFVGDSSG
jgi:glutamine cyclotransferase